MIFQPDGLANGHDDSSRFAFKAVRWIPGLWHTDLRKQVSAPSRMSITPWQQDPFPLIPRWLTLFRRRQCGRNKIYFISRTCSKKVFSSGLNDRKPCSISGATDSECQAGKKFLACARQIQVGSQMCFPRFAEIVLGRLSHVATPTYRESL